MDKPFNMSDLVCSECGNVFSIPRKKTQLREKYHIKDMYCPYCLKNTKFIEVKDAAMFKKQIEFASYVSKKEQFIYDLLCKNEDNNLKRL